MPTIPLTEDEEFLALVCSDEQLLAAEFDAIVAAGWSSTPPVEPDGDGALERPGRSTPQRFRAHAARPANLAGLAGIRAWVRERAPPGGPRLKAITQGGKAGDGLKGMDKHSLRSGPGPGRGHCQARKRCAR